MSTGVSAALSPDESQIGRLAALPDCFRLVTRAGPARERHAPIVAGGRGWVEGRMLGAGLKGPAHICLDVRGEAEQAAGLQHACEAVEIGRADETAFPVPVFR